MGWRRSHLSRYGRDSDVESHNLVKDDVGEGIENLASIAQRSRLEDVAAPLVGVKASKVYLVVSEGRNQQNKTENRS